jgi:hypothetical protein
VDCAEAMAKVERLTGAAKEADEAFKGLMESIKRAETLRRARTLRRRAVLAEVVSWIQVIFGALVTAMAVAVMVEWLS